MYTVGAHTSMQHAWYNREKFSMSSNFLTMVGHHHPYNYPGPLPGGYYAPEQPPYPPPHCHPPPPQDVNAGLPNAFVDYRYMHVQLIVQWL